MFLDFIVSWFEEERVVLLDRLESGDPMYSSDCLEDVTDPLEIVFGIHPGYTLLDTFHNFFTTLVIYH